MHHAERAKTRSNELQKKRVPKSVSAAVYARGVKGACRADSGTTKIESKTTRPNVGGAKIEISRAKVQRAATTY